MNTKHLYIGSHGFAFYCPWFALSITIREASFHLFNPSRAYRIRFN